MNFHQTHDFVKLLLCPFRSSSLITDDGKLLGSSDLDELQSSTSRLVVLQIAKKYLNPQIGDLIISNDPDNGGLNYQNLFFTTRLTERLYLVFVKECSALQFKIPPTPLFEKGSKNKTIWPFLVDQHPQAALLSVFFEDHWSQVSALKKMNVALSELSIVKNQISYLKVIQSIFDRHFGNRAIGQNEVLCKLNATEFVKLKLSIDEKQNQRSIAADFSQCSVAQKISAASHIIESGLVKALADHYDMTEFISQPLLDRIRLSLPPQSIVSKAHPLGAHNLLLQKIVVEQVVYLLSTLSRQTKTVAAFKLIPEFKIALKINHRLHLISGNSKRLQFPDLDHLIQTHQLMPLAAQNTDGKIKLKLKVKSTAEMMLVPQLLLSDYPQDFLMVSGRSVSANSETLLKQDDVLELSWSFK